MSQKEFVLQMTGKEQYNREQKGTIKYFQISLLQNEMRKGRGKEY